MIKEQEKFLEKALEIGKNEPFPQKGDYITLKAHYNLPGTDRPCVYTIDVANRRFSVGATTNIACRDVFHLTEEEMLKFLKEYRGE